MSEADVTVVIVPRERFSLTERSLESVYRNTSSPLRLVYVSAGPPPHVRRYLEGEARRRGFRLVHTDAFLSPNQARNLGLRYVNTRYVVFLDNDALVTPGWLEALVGCAEQTGAWVVGPLYFLGEIENQVVHMAGGEVQLREEEGQRVLSDGYRFADTPLAKIAEPLRRVACDFVEYHCVLVRTEVFERLGPLDEGLRSFHEHVDLGLAVRGAGGSVYLEPASVVTYIPPPPCVWSDLPYFLLRWSEDWNLASASHFKAKWRVSALRAPNDPPGADQPDNVLRGGRGHRRLMNGLYVPGNGASDGPTTDLEQAQLMAALLQSVDRETFDLRLTTPAGGVAEEAAALSPQGPLDCLPAVLRRAEADTLDVFLRPRAAGRRNDPALVRLDDLDAEALARVGPYAFLVLETAPETYQCWLAVARVQSGDAAALRRLLGTFAAPDGFARLAGTRDVSPQARQWDGTAPRVRLVEGRVGSLNLPRTLERRELLPYLCAAHLS